MATRDWTAHCIEQEGVTISGAMKPGYEKVLTPEAIDFAVEL